MKQNKKEHDMGRIDNLLQRHAEITSELRTEITAAISALPDNPKIKRLSRQCYTINSSDLGDNWSASYHDYSFQYRVLIERIELTDSIETLDKLVNMIIDSGFVKLPEGHHASRGMRGLQLHPDVVNGLRTIYRGVNSG